MPFCTWCGAQTRTDANFCTNCGRALHSEHASPTDTPVSKPKGEFLERLRGMESKVSCVYCMHRLPKNLCGAKESPNYNRTIRHEDQCERFTNNPAQLHYIRALFMDEYGSDNGLDGRKVAAQFQRAIEAGLPTDDEMNAKFHIGKWLALWTQGLNLELPKRAALPETRDAIAYTEAASALDREGGFGFFAQPGKRYWLRNLDMMYFAQGGLISIERGTGGMISDVAEIEYFEKKLALWSYLPSSPLLFTLKEAGYSYGRLGKNERSIECFRSILTAAPVDPFDNKGVEAELRDTAKACLQYLHEKERS